MKKRNPAKRKGCTTIKIELCNAPGIMEVRVIGKDVFGDDTAFSFFKQLEERLEWIGAPAEVNGKNLFENIIIYGPRQFVINGRNGFDWQRVKWAVVAALERQLGSSHSTRSTEKRIFGRSSGLNEFPY